MSYQRVRKSSGKIWQMDGKSMKYRMNWHWHSLEHGMKWWITWCEIVSFVFQFGWNGAFRSYLRTSTRLSDSGNETELSQTLSISSFRNILIHIHRFHSSYEWSEAMFMSSWQWKKLLIIGVSSCENHIIEALSISAFLIFFTLCHRSLIPLNWNVPKWSMAVRNDQKGVNMGSVIMLTTIALFWCLNPILRWLRGPCVKTSGVFQNIKFLL